jgi:polar amino acid transport system substrate-binding protein
MIRTSIALWLIGAMTALTWAGAPRAASAPAAAKLIVGTKHAPPFAIKSEDGTWSGVSIDLWRAVAAELDLKYEFKEYDLAGLLKATREGSIDAAVAALTVTAEREEAMDFTHPLHTTGLSIAVSPGSRAGWLGLLRRFLSLGFLKAVIALAVVLLGVGILAWWFERGKNKPQFGGSAIRGIGSGFWWSAVTMTTVGYGDKAPVTLGGRLVALVWMFAALIVVATFTGAIASALTVGQLEGAINGPADLPKVRVGTVEGSTSENYLRSRRIAYRASKTVAEGLRLVADKEIDAFVYDAPLLRYMANSEYRGKVEVLPIRFERQDYAIGLPSNSPIRETVNRVLLRKIVQREWQDTLYRYLGE